MDRGTLRLLLFTGEMTALAWLNETPGGPRVRGVELYAVIVGSYILGLVAASARKVDLAFFFRPSSRPSRRPPRYDGPRARLFFTHVLIFSGLSVLYFADILSTPGAVGLKDRVSPGLSLAAGLLAYGGLMGLFRGIAALRGRTPAGLRGTLRANRFLFPRDRRHFPWIVAAMILNPFAEEFLLRGVLVHLVGILTGWWIPIVLAGLVVQVFLHAYQGREAIPWHIAFYATAVGMLLSDFGLWGAFGLHIAGDLYPLLGFRWQFAALRRHRAGRPRPETVTAVPAAATASTPRGSRRRT